MITRLCMDEEQPNILFATKKKLMYGLLKAWSTKVSLLKNFLRPIVQNDPFIFKNGQTLYFLKFIFLKIHSNVIL